MAAPALTPPAEVTATQSARSRRVCRARRRSAVHSPVARVVCTRSTNKTAGESLNCKADCNAAAGFEVDSSATVAAIPREWTTAIEVRA